MRRFLFGAMAFMLGFAALTACAPAASTQEPVVVEAPTSTPVPVKLTPAQRAALADLSGKLGMPVDKLMLVSSEPVTWPNGCLGIVRIGVLCTQAEVPGFRIVLAAAGQKYEYHTNQDGSTVVLAEGAQGAGSAEQTSIQQLASSLGLQASDISVISNVEVEFGDACLGVAMPNVLCAQVITPGHIIVLEAKGIQYEYHASADGSRVQPATLAMVWKREGGIAGFCDSLTVFRSGEVYTSQCKSASEGRMGTFADLLSGREQEQFVTWMARFGEADLDASDPTGVADRMVVTLTLYGDGSLQPAKSDQQALFEFAQNLFQKAVR